MSLLAIMLVLSQWLSPIPGAQISQDFDPPHQSWGAGHRGVDFVATVGTQVQSIGPGTVVFVGQIAGKAVISIDHPTLGLRSTYEPVTASVHVGDLVQSGELIGVVAARAGHCAGVCLHLGLKGPTLGDYRNPLDLFEGGFAVLKPLAG